jgi:uncharacterized membrane protein YhhN
MAAFLLLSAILAPLNWYAVWVGNRRLEWIAKPGVMISLSLWFSTYPAWALTGPGGIYLVGMLFSLAGDVFLMLDRRHFIKGLLAFLFSHLAYISVFNQPSMLLEPGTLALAALLAVIVGVLLRQIIISLRSSGKPGLVLPVTVYGFVLMLTCWSTLVCLLRPEWPDTAAAMAAGGGVLFLLSDSLLAWNRFVRPIPRGRLWTMLSYHWSQFLLASSVLSYLGSIN